MLSHGHRFLPIHLLYSLVDLKSKDFKSPFGAKVSTCGTSQKKEYGILQQSVGEKPFGVNSILIYEYGKVRQPRQKKKQV